MRTFPFLTLLIAFPLYAFAADGPAAANPTPESPEIDASQHTQPAAELTFDVVFV